MRTIIPNEKYLKPPSNWMCFFEFVFQLESTTFYIISFARIRLSYNNLLAANMLYLGLDHVPFCSGHYRYWQFYSLTH